ncbi:MAG: isoleucine--tRNA ligase [Halococcoides sp.]
MDRFAEVAEQFDPQETRAEARAHWSAVDAYERTKAHRSDGESLYFLDGPPYTTGAAHMGTTLNKTLKDAYIRYFRMCGYDVTDRPGFDMHGLPIETKVEQQLGFENKGDIEAFGEDAFIDECKAFAEDRLDGLRADFESFGVWMDWENPYKTIDPGYMEAAWWGFQRAHERDLVEQGQRSINQCPRCETAIANNEVERHTVEKPSIYVTFDLIDREGSLVIWTTTPWTIPANTFVAVDPDATYQAVAVGEGEDEQIIYVAEACREAVLEAAGDADGEVRETLSGEDLIGWEYEHPLADLVPEAPAATHADGAGQVYAADYVEADRTGMVHSAPGHGEVDFERGQELDLPIFCPVGPDGVYTGRAGAYEGTFVRDANDEVIADLRDRDRLLASESGHTVNEGQCWRCDTDIVRLVTDQWFITVSDVKEDLLANIQDSEWYPQSARDGRFTDFVEDSPDWNVSRQRYWGIPIPIWTPEETVGGKPIDWDGDMSEVIVIGDRDELADRVDQSIDADSVDIHKDTVDDLTITEDGVIYTRVPDVFDVWLDSSVASWGSLGYPSDDEAFEELWPADVIIEAHDQTRGWFWSQLGMGTAALDRVPYESVLMHGHALMPDGRAMSKSRNITVEPGEVMEEYGADPMRLFLLSVTPQGDDMRFSYDECEAMERRLNILWNVFRFPLPYMRLDGFDPETTDLDAVADDLETVDQWVLSRLQSVLTTSTESFESFRQDRALDALLDFIVEDVSRLYVQEVRERMWEPADSPSKRAAYATLYHVLETVCRLLAPYAPHTAERIYQHLTGEAGHPTVHMCDWPAVDPAFQDAALEAEIEAVRAAEEAGSNARQRAERKLRWPVPAVVVDPSDADLAAALDAHTDLLAERLNAREVRVLDADAPWSELTYGADADMGALGPAFGADAEAVMEALNDARVDEPTVEALEAAVEAATDLTDVDLDESMIEIVRHAPENVAESAFEALDSEGVVYVDCTITDDVESEGYAREVIRRIQEMRKDLDLDMDERIRVEIDAPEVIATSVDEHRDLIAEEVRADKFETVEDGLRETWTIEDSEAVIAIEALATADA